jgi:hypothetical protein
MNIGRRVLARYLQKQALIAVPPRSLSGLFSIVLRKLSGVRRMKEIAEKIAHDRDDAPDYTYWTSKAEIDEYDLSSYTERAERTEEQIKRTIEYARYGQPDIDQMLVYAKDFSENARFIAFADSSTNKMDAAASECSFLPSMLSLFKEFHHLAHEFTEAMRLLQTKLQTLRDAAAMDHNDNSALPKHEKIETLYHASIYARDLARTGFESSRPKGGGLGLGGSVEDKAGNNAISFTYDLKYALEIARWFKEVAMVYTGQIKLHQVLRWIEDEGMVEEVLSGMRGLYKTCEGGTFDVMADGVTCIDEENGKWKFTLEKFDRTLNKNVMSPGDPDRIFQTREDVWNLYNAYLNRSKLRENPIGDMGSLLRTMQAKNVDPKGIGVIVAEVDMSDPDILHKPAERELRVQPRAIKKIVRVL